MTHKEIKDELHGEIERQPYSFQEARAAKAVADRLVERVARIVKDAVRDAKK